MTTRTMKTEAAVYEAIRKTYPAPEYAVLPGVADGTGGNSRRRIDALVMNCWPSRGLTIAAIEIKVSRSDVHRELKKPAKAEAIARYCDQFWMAVGDASIVAAEELPPTWGLLVPGRGGKMVVARESAALEPAPLTREFLAAILRRAVDRFDGDDLRAELRRAAIEEVASELDELRDRAKDAWKVDRLRERLARMEQFEQWAGVTFAAWNEVEMLAAANLVKSLRGTEGERLRHAARREAESLQRTADAMAKAAQRTLDALAESGDGADG